MKDDFSSLLSETEQEQLMGKEDNIIDHKCFISLLVPNQTRIQAFILSLVPNISDADDIYQRLFMEFGQSITVENGRLLFRF